MAAYMKIDGPGVPGQATDSKHVDWIPILSMSQDVARPLAHGAGVGGQSAVEFHDIDISTKMGKHVPELAKAIASGTDFDSIQIDVCTDQGGGNREPYYIIKLEKVHVTRFSVSSAAMGGEGDTVSIGLHFDKIEWEFVQWHGKEKKGTTTTTWNVAENTE